MPLLLLGMLGGCLLYLITRGKYNPTIGIEGVSCLPSKVRVALNEKKKLQSASQGATDSIDEAAEPLA